GSGPGLPFGAPDPGLTALGDGTSGRAGALCSGFAIPFASPAPDADPVTVFGRESAPAVAGGAGGEAEAGPMPFAGRGAGRAGWPACWAPGFGLRRCCQLPGFGPAPGIRLGSGLAGGLGGGLADAGGGGFWATGRSA